MILLYNNIPCLVIQKKDHDSYLILYKEEQRWIYESSFGYGKMSFYNKDIRYFFNDIIHREGGPAIIYSNGDKFWFVNGNLH